MHSSTDNLSSMLDQLHPDREELLACIARQVTDDMLREIARADYGEDAAAHFDALVGIRDLYDVPAPLDWVPGEVLDLTRWSRPDEAHDATPERVRRGHLCRAFACCALLLESAANDGSINGCPDTLVRLLGSVLTLGDEVAANATRFLAWRLGQPFADEMEAPIYAFALLLLLLHTYDRDPKPEAIDVLAHWIVHEEVRLVTEEPNRLCSSRWLMGLTGNQDRSEWEQLTRTLLLDPPQALAPNTGATLRDMALRLLDEKA